MQLACASSDERSDVDATSQDRRVPLLGSVDRRKMIINRKKNWCNRDHNRNRVEKKENLAGGAKGKLLGLQAGEKKSGGELGAFAGGA